MKQTRQKRKQHGFFSFGIGLGLMILFSGTAAVVSSKNESQNNSISQKAAVIYETKQSVNSNND